MEEKYWIIDLGYEGPTDACLTLTSPEGICYEASIDSEAWKMLSGLSSSFAYWSWCMDKIYTKSNEPLYSNHAWPVKILTTHYCARICELIFNSHIGW